MPSGVTPRSPTPAEIASCQAQCPPVGIGPCSYDQVQKGCGSARGAGDQCICPPPCTPAQNAAGCYMPPGNGSVSQCYCPGPVDPNDPGGCKKIGCVWDPYKRVCDCSGSMSSIEGFSAKRVIKSWWTWLILAAILALIFYFYFYKKSRTF